NRKHCGKVFRRAANSGVSQELTGIICPPHLPKFHAGPQREGDPKMAVVQPTASAPATPQENVFQFKTPPHSIEAEQSMLGALLLDNQAFDRVADLVVGEDFYRDDHRRIWRHIAKLIDQ